MMDYIDMIVVTVGIAYVIHLILDLIEAKKDDLDI